MNLRKIALESGASQDPFELWQTLLNVDSLKPRAILEIGIDKGYSAQTWRNAFPEALVVGIDNDLSRLDYNDFEIIRGNSRDSEISSMARNRVDHYDFLFIDGDHKYAGAKADWERYAPMVRQGGIIGLHDSNRIGEAWRDHVEVRQLVDEIKASHSIPCIEITVGPASPGTTLFFV